MKKLFLRSGDLFVNEFPEEPVPYGVGDEQYYGARMDEYDDAVSAAIESAVKVVGLNVNDHIAIALTIGEIMQEGKLYSLQKGWDVEYEDQIKVSTHEDARWQRASDYSEDIVFETRRIARLIPLVGKGYQTIEHSSSYETPDGIHGTNYGVRQSGIVATGLPESGDFGTWMVQEKDIPAVHAQLDKILGVKSPVIPEGSEKPEFDRFMVCGPKKKKPLDLSNVGEKIHHRAADGSIKPGKQAIDDTLKGLGDWKQLPEENQRLKNDLLDALDLKNGNGPTALSMVVGENQRLKEALKTCFDELMYKSTTGHFWMWARNNGPVPEKLIEMRKLIEP